MSCARCGSTMLTPEGYCAGCGSPWARLRAPHGLADNLAFVLGLTTLVWAGGYVIQLANLLSGHGPATGSSSWSSIQIVATVMSMLTRLVCIVLFLVWFRQARALAGIFAPELQRRKPGWAVGAWFVPLGALWMPKQIANDIHAASVGAGGRPVKGLINAWWICFLASNTTFWITGNLPNAVLAAVEILNLSVLCASGVLAILFVRRMTGLQAARIARGPLNA